MHSAWLSLITLPFPSQYMADWVVQRKMSWHVLSITHSSIFIVPSALLHLQLFICLFVCSLVSMSNTRCTGPRCRYTSQPHLLYLYAFTSLFLFFVCVFFLWSYANTRCFSEIKQLQLFRTKWCYSVHFCNVQLFFSVYNNTSPSMFTMLLSFTLPPFMHFRSSACMCLLFLCLRVGIFTTFNFQLSKTAFYCSDRNGIGFRL